MKGKLTIAALAMAAAMLAMPAGAQAGHKHHGWSKKCSMMHMMQWWSHLHHGKWAMMHHHGKKKHVRKARKSSKPAK